MNLWKETGTTRKVYAVASQSDAVGALTRAKRSPPTCVKGRWMSIDKCEDLIDVGLWHEVRSTLIYVLENRVAALGKFDDDMPMPVLLPPREPIPIGDDAPAPVAPPAAAAAAATVVAKAVDDMTDAIAAESSKSYKNALVDGDEIRWFFFKMSIGTMS